MITIGDTIKSRTITDEVRYLPATVMNVDTVEIAKKLRSIYLVVDRDGNTHEIWNDSIFYVET